MATQTERGNRYAGTCVVCGQNVPAGEGRLFGNRQTGYTVMHRAARLVGWPGTWVGGCPERNGGE